MLTKGGETTILKAKKKKIGLFLTQPPWLFLSGRAGFNFFFRTTPPRLNFRGENFLTYPQRRGYFGGFFSPGNWGTGGAHFFAGVSGAFFFWDCFGLDFGPGGGGRGGGELGFRRGFFQGENRFFSGAFGVGLKGD